MVSRTTLVRKSVCIHGARAWQRAFERLRLRNLEQEIRIIDIGIEHGHGLAAEGEIGASDVACHGGAPGLAPASGNDRVNGRRLMKFKLVEQMRPARRDQRQGGPGIQPAVNNITEALEAAGVVQVDHPVLPGGAQLGNVPGAIGVSDMSGGGRQADVVERGNPGGKIPGDFQAGIHVGEPVGGAVRPRRQDDTQLAIDLWRRLPVQLRQPIPFRAPQ